MSDDRLDDEELVYLLGHLRDLPYVENNLCDLIISDAPLTAEQRSEIAVVVRALYAGMSLKQWQGWQQDVTLFGKFIMKKKRYRREGMSALDAEALAERDLNYKDGTIRKRMQRYKKKQADC